MDAAVDGPSPAEETTSEMGAPTRSSIFSVLGVALGLMIVAGAILGPFGGKGQTLDGAAFLSEHFQVGETPFGLEVIEAVHLPAGEDVVVLVHPDAPPLEKADFAIGGGGHDGERGSSRGRGRGGDRGQGGGGDEEGEEEDKFDWGTVKLGETGADPIAMTFVWYPRKDAERTFGSLFGRVRFSEMREIDSNGGRLVVDAGELDWAGYQAHYVRERTYEKVAGKAVFREALRVNLSVGERPCVLFIEWQRGQLGSTEKAEKALLCFGPPL